MLLGVAGRGAPTACLRAFSFSSPRFAHCTSGSVLRCRPRCVRNVNVPRGRWSAQILLCLIGFSSAPTCVWAAPKGVEELGIVADRVQAAREFLPVELKHAASSIVERTEDPHDEALARVDPEPIQHSVARMQTEAMLEAYGEAVDPPCLKVVVLFPDGPDIMVLINDVSGGLAQIIKDTRDAVMCVSEETDLLVVEDQARHNVLHVMAVPKWVDASLRACILVDLSAVGGPSFASLTWTLVYRGDIDRVAGRFAASWDIYSSGEFSPWGPTGAHKVVSGMSVKVVPKGALPQWSNPLPNIPWHLWTRADPGPSFQQTLEYWLVSQDDGAWLVQHGCREAATLHDVIADRLGADQSLLDLVVVGDGDFVGDIRVEGLKISGVVAPVHRQASRTEDSVTTPVVFIDGRAVGRGVRSLKVSPGHLDPVAILRLIDPQIPTGYVAQVTLLDGSSLEDASVEPNSHLVTRVIVCQSTENPASSGEVPDAPVLDASLPTVLGSNAGEEGPEVPCIIDKAWFLIFAPDCAPEEVWVSFEQPASWEDVSASVIGARQDDRNQDFDNLISVYPQPSDEFGSLLCLPSWAADAVSVLVDSRQFDVRLYCLVVEPWMQWESFRIRANLSEARDFVIIIRGVLQPRGRPLTFSQGDLVVIQDLGSDFPPIIDLCDMFVSGDRWDEEEPLAISPSWSHYLVLHDGGTLGVEVDFKKISNSFGFIDFAAELLRGFSWKVLVQGETTLESLLRVLARLRRVTGELGQPWRYAPAPNAIVLDDDDTSSEGEQGLLVQVQCLRVCIVAPGFAWDQFQVYLQTPATVEEAVQCVQPCRVEGLAELFPKIVPVRPQPYCAQFFFIALPSWPVVEVTTKIAVCFDTSAIDGRVFATFVPAYVSRHQPPGFEYRITIGSANSDIAHTSACHVAEGELVCFQLLDVEQVPLPTMEQELVMGEGRSAGGPILCQPDSDAYLLVDGRDNILHLADFGRPTRYREQIAACVGIRLRDLRLFPSQPRSVDAALEGIPCRTTIAVGDANRYTSADTFEVIVDARAVLLGWFTVTAVACRVSCTCILQTLIPEVSPRLLLSLADVPTGTDTLEVVPGQILVVRADQAGLAGIHFAEPTEPLGERRVSPGYGPTSGETPPGRSGEEAPDRDGSDTDTPENPPGPPPIAEPGQGESVGVDTVINYFEATFVVVKQSFTHEVIRVRLPEGVAVEDALSAVSAACSPHYQTRTPCIREVWQQPRGDHALVVGVPDWPFEGSIVVVDTRTINGAAAHVIGSIGRVDFLTLSGIPGNIEVEIYVGDLPWPLPHGLRVEVRTGDLILFTPARHGVHVVSSLTEMLSSAFGWSLFEDIVEDPREQAWILSPDGPFAIVVLEHRRLHLREDIARLLEVPARQLILRPALADLDDFAYKHIRTRNVIVAVMAPGARGHRHARAEICILDLRPLLLELEWHFCPGGEFNTERYLARLRHRCPEGFHVAVIDSDGSIVAIGDNVEVADGSVLTVIFRLDVAHHRDAHVLLDTVGESSAHDGGAGADQTGPTSGTPRDADDEEPNNADAGTGGSYRRSRDTHRQTTIAQNVDARDGQVMRESLCMRQPPGGSQWRCVAQSRLAVCRLFALGMLCALAAAAVSVRGNCGVFATFSLHRTCGTGTSVPLSLSVSVGQMAEDPFATALASLDALQPCHMHSFVGPITELEPGGNIGNEFADMAPARGAMLAKQLVDHKVLDTWWSETENLLCRESRGRLLVVGADCNAALGSVSSAAVSEAEAEEQDHAGGCLHAVLHKCELWAPATWPTHQVGPGWTFMQRRNGALSRPDFILLPESWKTGEVQAWTEAGITAANLVIDHLATAVDVQLCVRCGPGPPKDQRDRIDARALTCTDNREKLREILKDAPRPAWEVNPHSHVAVLTEYLQEKLTEAFPAPRGRPLHPFLSAEAWDLQKQVSWLRRRCAKVRTVLRRHVTIAVFAAWKGPVRHVPFTYAAWLREMQAAYVSGLADEVQARPAQAFGAVNALLCRRRKKPFAPAVLPSVRDKDGKPCASPADAMRRWRQHFSDLEAGSDVSPQHLGRLALSRCGRVWPMPTRWSRNGGFRRVYVPWDGLRHWGPPSPATCSVALSELLWADDVSACVAAEKANDLARVVGVEVGTLADAFSSHGFQLSFGPRKTAAMLNPRGKGAREVRRAIFRGTPSIPVLREHEGAAVLPVVDTYKHLGVVQSYDGSIRAEVKQRCAQAWSAFREGRTRVFRCKRVALARRGALLEVLVMSKLRFGCGAWPPLGITESKLFSGAVTGIYRATLGLSRQDDQHVSLETMCALLRQPDPFTILRVEQLRYLRQLIAHAPDALWALLRQDVPFIAMLRDTLAWLYARTLTGEFLRHPPVTVEGVLSELHSAEDPAAYSKGLLDALGGLLCFDADSIWSAVVDFVEPISVLRHTLHLWRSGAAFPAAADDAVSDVSYVATLFGEPRV
ncbi:unnamed protein product [Symbiodinium microadriaticum]|nr:unnamed protein product [Symbiodinium microadriaticum]